MKPNPANDPALPPFTAPPAVVFSVFGEADLLREARRNRVGDTTLRSRVVATLRRHGLDLNATYVFCGRWSTLVEGIEVLYDVGPGDQVMVVAMGTNRKIRLEDLRCAAG